MTMEAVRFDSSTKKLSLQKVEIPKNPGPGEVIVKVAYAGICGTDLHIIDVSTVLQNICLLYTQVLVPSGHWITS